MRVGDDLEHRAPRVRVVGEVVAARPLVVGEDHRAVLDRDLHAVLARVRDQRRPQLGEALEVLRQRPGLVVARERADGGHAELAGRLDHLAQVRVGGARAPRRRGRGCSGSRRARRSSARAAPASRRPACGREVLDVDVARRPRSAARRPRRPASRRPRASRSRWRPPTRRSRRGSGREGRGEQAELHAGTSCGVDARATSTQRPSRALAPIASAISASSWPSANVG